MGMAGGHGRRSRGGPVGARDGGQRGRAGRGRGRGARHQSVVVSRPGGGAFRTRRGGVGARRARGAPPRSVVHRDRRGGRDAGGPLRASRPGRRVRRRVSLLPGARHLQTVSPPPPGAPARRVGHHARCPRGRGLRQRARAGRLVDAGQVGASGRTPLRAELIAVGTELLWGDRADTNTLALCDALAGLGIEVAAKTLVGDDEPDLARVLADAMARASLVILTGGLGATHDDVTTRVVAKVAGRRLTLRDDVLDGIKAAYRRRGREAPPSCERPALLPARAEALPNPVGTAPGFRLTHRGVDVVALPGA